MSGGTGAEVTPKRGSTAPLSFPVALGHRLRQVREELGATGTEIAASCRWVGLNWDRPTLTRVEQGKRQVTVGELLLLTVVYDRPLADLLPTEPVALTMGPRGTTATPDALRSCLIEPPSIPGGWQTGPGIMADLHAAMPFYQGLLRRVAEEQPGAPITVQLHAAEHSSDEATSKAAKTLGASAREVATAAEMLWRRGLAAERDARAAALGPTTSARARQARRGHVTRRLIQELRPVIDKVRAGQDTGEDEGHVQH